MPKPDNRFQAMAEQVARRLDRAAAIGDQLSLLPPDPADSLEAGAGRGRGKAKAGGALGKWLAAQGYRDPGEVLAEMAGLASDLDPVTEAMARVAQIEAGIGTMTQGQRLATFQVVYASKLRALDALMPYMHGKAEAPAAPPPAVHVHVTAPAGQPGDGARVVNADAEGGAQGAGPGAGRAQGVTFAPPPMPTQDKQNQGVSE